VESVRLVQSKCARLHVHCPLELDTASEDCQRCRRGLRVTVVSPRQCGGLHFEARRDKAIWLERAGFRLTSSMVLNWVRFVDGIHFFARERREEVRLIGY
jgi:hypothetical protein